MSNFLTKEEIRRWRSSLERMTLEEYAAKLGKSVNTEKETHDIVDKVMPHNSLEHMTIEEYRPKAETIKSIAQKALLKEKELANKYNIRIKPETEKSADISNAPLTPTLSRTGEKEEKLKNLSPKKAIDNEKLYKKIADEPIDVDAAKYAFKKALTQRERAVLDYFTNNTNKIIYAKELATLLGLPRDYIYKYIKTLRNKLQVDCIQNAENGGFILK